MPDQPSSSFAEFLVAAGPVPSDHDRLPRARHASHLDRAMVARVLSTGFEPGQTQPFHASRSRFGDLVGDVSAAVACFS